MALRDDFTDKFRQLLKSVPDGYTLEHWQHAYRQAIFLMGMQILERFEEEAITGPRRIAEGGGGGRAEGAQPAAVPGGPIIYFIDSHGGGSGGGWNPSIFRPCNGNVFPDYPLSLQPIGDPMGRSARRE